MTPLTLNTPIVHDDITYKEAMIQEPTVGAVEAMNIALTNGASPSTASIILCAATLGWPQEVYRKLSFSDAMAIEAALTPFLKPFMSTEETLDT